MASLVAVALPAAVPVPVVSTIAVFEADGTLAVVGPAGMPLRAGQTSVALPAGYTPETFDWNTATRTMVENPAKVQILLVARVKALAATKKMVAISPGTAKPEEYRLKAPEIAASANVLAAVLNGLTAANAMAQYPAAATEARLTGEPLAVVLARFRSGAVNSDPEVYRLSAIEHAAVARIKAAPNAAAKWAAYAAINWTWTA